MAQNITVQGASYADVPAVELPKTGGGTASFTDVSDTTAAAGDVASGKYFYTAAGQRTEGTASGGGGGTTISTAGQYDLDPGDTVTMGTGIYGDLTAMGKRVLTNSWDFTSGSLVDSVGGLTATLSNSPTQDSSGITISAQNQSIAFPLLYSANKTYEIDFGTISKTFSSGHGRVFMVNNNAAEGLVYQSAANWNAYLNGVWSTRNNGGDATAFSGKTLRVTTHEIKTYSGGDDSATSYMKFYIDGVLWYIPPSIENVPVGTNQKLWIGAGATGFVTMIIRGFRVYDGILA